MSPILFACAVALLGGAVLVLLLRTFFTTCVGYAEASSRVDLSWKDYPFHRLLDPADLNYLRRRGIGEAEVRKVRTQRRKLFRHCLRSLAQDFNAIHHALKIVLIQSANDRPDLAVILARQRMGFYRNLFMVEGWLLLHACGLEHMPVVDLVQPLQILRTALSQFTVEAMPAGAGI